MAEVVLFHSVLGLRPGVISAADRLRAAGHTVHTPELYDGEVFDELEDGMRKEEVLDYREIAGRAREAVAGLPEEWSTPGSLWGRTRRVAGSQKCAGPVRRRRLVGVRQRVRTPPAVAGYSRSPTARSRLPDTAQGSEERA